ncbi:hypothetical protein B0H34DRAFT_645984 [Crassisporium funariophilum]|nr:hypothetical protein B0H34DRAFT_645984 [Crassisporium funariophilum]
MALHGLADLNSTLEGLNCINCGRFVKFQPCKTDKNGNKGVLYATCHSINEEGKCCSFIRRASRSPSVSPKLPSQPVFASPLVLPSTALVPATAGHCPVWGCGQTRLADDCLSGMCWKHCIEQRQGKSHPRFANHLRPIFTQVVADQQEKLRLQTVLDAELKEKAQKAKQRIAVYPWTTEDTAPTVKIFQDFTWLYLTITTGLLAAIGLLEASEQGNLRMYDENNIQDWVAVDIGYVMEVCEGQRLFLKDALVRKCLPVANPTLSPPALSQPSQGESSPVGGTGGFHDPMEIDDDGNEKHWPADYYTIDIGNCMRKCSSRTHRAHQRANTQRTVFTKCFPGVRFIASTFSNQRDLWNKSSRSLREEFMELGRCKEGLWLAFVKHARREQKAQAKAVTVIEID